MKPLSVLSLIAATAVGAGMQQPAQFAVAVDVVNIDVLVTDEDGNFVPGLQLEDFTVYEDEEPQDLIGLDLVDLADAATAEVAALSRDWAGVYPAPSDLGAVIFFLDFPGLYFRNKLRFADSLVAMLNGINGLRVPHAVYFVDLAGDLKELVPLTLDIDQLRDAARTARELPLVQTREDILAFLDGGAAALSSWAQSRERRRAFETFELLTEFVWSLIARSGRKTLVWVSTGVDLAAYETVARGREGDPRQGFRFYSVDNARTAAQQRLHDAANAANVTIYSVDPSALHEFYSLGGSSRAGTAADARGNSLRDAALETGGLAFIGWSELARVLEQIERDSARFYVLSYKSSHEPTIDEYHDIRVEVNRPQVEARTRQGYVHGTSVGRIRNMILGALEFPSIVSGLVVAAERIRARNADGDDVLIAAIRIDSPNRRGAAPLITGSELWVYATVHAADGSIVKRAEGMVKVPPTRQRSAYLPIPENTLPLLHEWRWELDPGEYSVTVAVMDPVANRIGAAAFETEIPEHLDAWYSSDPALLMTRSNGDTAVVVGEVPYADQPARVYVEVYGGESPTLGTVVEVAPERAGAQDVEHTAQWASEKVLERQGDIHRGSLELPRLAPGDYDLRIVTEDVPLGISRDVSLPLRVVRR